MLDVQRWRDRWPALDSVLRVNERFGAIGGGSLAASIGLAAFLSLFPLVLVAIAVVGFLSTGDSTFARDVVADLHLEGRSAEVITDAIATAEDSRRAASLIGLAGLAWGGLGVVGALQHAINAAWQTPGRGLIDRLRTLVWLLGAGVLFLASMGLGPLLGFLPAPAIVLTLVLGLALSTALFLWTFSFLGNQPVPWTAHLPGALLVGVGFEILKVIGAVYVPRAVASSSALYGTLGVVFAVLAWLLVYARLIVYGSVLNVLRWEAASGTVTVEIEVPRMRGEVPLSAGRGGAISEMADPDATAE